MGGKEFRLRSTQDGIAVRARPRDQIRRGVAQQDAHGGSRATGACEGRRFGVARSIDPFLRDLTPPISRMRSRPSVPVANPVLALILRRTRCIRALAFSSAYSNASIGGKRMGGAFSSSASLSFPTP